MCWLASRCFGLGVLILSVWQHRSMASRHLPVMATCVLVLVIGVYSADDHQGDTLMDMANVLNNFQIAPAVTAAGNGEANRIIRELSKMPGPRSKVLTHRRENPWHPVPEACDRDYKMQCPLTWVNIGTAFGGAVSQCVAGARYSGPCSGEAISFRSLTKTSKARWSNTCRALWPCIRCQRNYSSLCPKDWERIGPDLTCAPTSTYDGRCRGAVDFSGYTRKMMYEWSSVCGAFWPCNAEAAKQPILPTSVLSEDSAWSPGA